MLLHLEKKVVYSCVEYYTYTYIIKDVYHCQLIYKNQLQIYY